ncbi:MAG: CooT family nickel-binding protein [Deltaproteobacteria bacterium]|nr:CooT family nickel-binding protein [Deltaproteobacteria bacterium]
MCELHAYLQRQGKEELILENVDSMETDDDTVRLVSIFGEEKIVCGTLKLVSLRANKIVVIETV